jgi:hypothetical protein
MFQGPPITLRVADSSTDELTVDGSTVEAANFEINPSRFTQSKAGGFVGAEVPLLNQLRKNITLETPIPPPEIR